MAIKVVINGFGRIGRLVFRVCMANPNIEVVGINHPGIEELEYMQYLLRYDTVHGKFGGTIDIKGDKLIVTARRFRYSGASTPRRFRGRLAALNM